MKTPAQDQSSKWMFWGIGAFTLWILAALGTNFCLYADGAHEFIRVLEAQDFVYFWWSRHFAYGIYQLLLVAALKLGITNLTVLKFAYGLGCFLPWALSLLLCRWISPKHFWLAVVGCAAGYLNGAYMPVGQHGVAHALFWPALFVLFFAKPLRAGHAVVLITMATGLQYAYESQTFLCLPLCGLAVWRAVSEKATGQNGSWIIFGAASALFLTSVLNGFYSILMPEVPGNMQAFKTGTLEMLTKPGWTVGWTVLLGLVAGCVCASKKLAGFFTTFAGFCVLLAAVLVWGIWPILCPAKTDTGVQYDHRAMNLLVPYALLPVAWVLVFRPMWLADHIGKLKTFAAVLLLAQSLWHLSCAFRWHQDTMLMRQILATKQGVVPLDHTPLEANGMLGRQLRPDAIGGRFDWSWPCLSIAINPKKDIGCLICSPTFLNPALRAQCWQPFDVLQPDTLPKLSRYGIDYTNFVTILHKQLE